MFIAGHRKAMLTAAVAAALTSFQAVSAADKTPANVGAPQSSVQSVGDSQSGFTPVAVGVETDLQGNKTGSVSPIAEKPAAEEKSFTVPTVEGASAPEATLYLSPADEAAIQPYAGRTVTKVDFAGLPAEVKVKLAPLLQTKQGDVLSIDSVRADAAALGGTGVFAQVSPVVTEVPEGVQLSYKMTANPIVHEVEFTGNTVFTSDYLNSLMQVPKDSVLNTVLVNQKLKEIEDLYMKQGYILMSIPNVEVTPKGVLHVTIAEGTVEDITIVGNDKTKDYVITREMKLKKGQAFNKFLASRSMERVYNLGFFEDVNMKLLPGKQEHNVIVEVDLVEQKTGVVTIGAGYSESDGMVGILELGENNFRGTGDKVNFHWEFGGSSHGRNYQISYTRPWINSNGDSLGFSFYDRRYSYDDYNADGDTVASYDKRRKGYSLTWGRVTGEYQTNYLNWESVRESYDPEDGFDLNAPAGKYDEWRDAIMNNFGRTNSATLTHVFDSRDNYYNATKGHRWSFSGQVAGHGLGGDYDFYKFTAEGRFYKKLSNGHVLAMRLMGGYMTGDSPYTQLFSLGGSDTVRGYEDDQFKGKNMYAATLEYRFPIVKKVEGVLFTDAGSAWKLDEGKIPWYESDDSIHFAFGAGIRLQTPIGPIRLDYGHGDRNKFHFSFGTQF